jgi:hypothetical protein
MKKLFLGIVVLSLLLSSCGTHVTEVTSSGKEYQVFKASKFAKSFSECTYDDTWYGNAKKNDTPLEAIVDCYKTFKTYQICLQWDYVYERYVYSEQFKTIKKHREALSETLIRKESNPFLCRSGDKDLRTRYETEIKKAKQRASSAESNLANAESRANQAESDADYWRSEAQNN